MATAITSTSFFGRSPEGFSHTEEGSRAHFRAKETEIKRYYTKTTRPNYRHNSEIGFEYSCASFLSFYSFKDRFSYNFQPMLLISGRLGHFLTNWRLITQDSAILNTVQGYKLCEKTQGKYFPVQTKLTRLITHLLYGFWFIFFSVFSSICSSSELVGFASRLQLVYIQFAQLIDKQLSRKATLFQDVLLFELFHKIHTQSSFIFI